MVKFATRLKAILHNLYIKSMLENPRWKKLLLVVFNSLNTPLKTERLME